MGSYSKLFKSFNGRRGAYLGIVLVFLITNLSALPVYAKGVSKTGHSVSSKIKSARLAVDKTPPVVPSMPNSKVSDKIVDLSWARNSDKDLKGYKIYRNGNLLGSSPLAYYADISIIQDGEYQYTISAFDKSNNESAQSAVCKVIVDTTPPQIPEGFNARLKSALVAELVWKANPEADLKKYNIYRNGGLIDSVAAGVGTYSDYLLNPSGSFSYAMTAVDITGNESEKSTVAIITIGYYLTPDAILTPASVSTLKAIVPDKVPALAPDLLTVSAPVLDLSASNSVIVPAPVLAPGGSVSSPVPDLMPTPALIPPASTLNPDIVSTPIFDTPAPDAGSIPVVDFSAPVLLPAPVPHTPMFIDPVTVWSADENSSLSFVVSAVDVDGDTLSYSVDALPKGANFDAANQLFSWTPDYTQSGIYTVNFSVSDGKLSSSEPVTIAVNNVNRAPILSAIGNSLVKEGLPLSFTLAATDPDGDILYYSSNNLPSGATLTGNYFSWTPAAGQAGTYNIIFNVIDGSLSDSKSTSIEVGSIVKYSLPAATGLKTEGVISPARGTALYPKFSWSFSGDGTQQGWEIQAQEWSPLQLSSDPSGDGTFYLSGQVTNPDPLYKLSSVIMASWGSRPGSHYERAAGISHAYKWRIRLYDGTNWGEFSAWQTYLYDQAPSMPQDVMVNDTGSGLAVNLSPVTKALGNTIYVKTPADGGNDAFDGKTPAAAVATINKALKLVSSGDTVLSYPGTYNEIVAILNVDVDYHVKIPGLVASLPKLTNITIKGAAPGVIIDGKGLQLAAADGGVVYINSDNISLENITVTDSGVVGSYTNSIIIRGNNNALRSIYADAGIPIFGNGHILKNSTIRINSGGIEAIDISGYGVDVIGNNISGDGVLSGVRVSRDSVGVNIIGNVMHLNASTSGSRGVKTYDGQYVLIANNFIENTEIGVFLYRSSHNIVAGNTIVDNPMGIALDEAWDNYLYNNIITNSSDTAIEYGLFGHAYNVYTDYNLLYKDKNNYGYFNKDPAGTIIDGGHNKLDQDPLFFDVMDKDYTPQPGSPAIDSGKAGYPTQKGSGATSDLGAFEYGATPWAAYSAGEWAVNSIPEFEPLFTLSTQNPVISWAFKDTDNEIFGADTDKQYSFQIELDKVITFDGPALLRSGTITGSQVSAKINNALAAGKYYFRIRMADNFYPDMFGPWSDPRGAFEVKDSSLDNTAPQSIADLSIANPTQDSAILTWTSSGDDGATGAAKTYDIRYSTSNITEANWAYAAEVNGVPLPQIAGASQSMVIPGLSAATTYYFAIKVSDEVPNISGLSNVVAIKTNSNPPLKVNQAPALSFIGNKTVNEGQLLGFNLSAVDVDGDTLVYSATGLPAGAALMDNYFSWTPGYDQAGIYNMTFIASDGTVAVSETISVTVNNTNRAPVLSNIGDKLANENYSLSFVISASDPDGDTLIYSASGLPAGAVLSGNIFSWVPDYTQAGVYPVTFTASDGSLSASESITITVNDTLVIDSPFASNLMAEFKSTPARGAAIYPILTWKFSSPAGKTQQGWNIQVQEWALDNINSDPAGDGTFYDSGLVMNPDSYYDKTAVTMAFWGSRAGLKFGRAAGRTHAYKWRIKVFDGAQWGNFSSWQVYISDQTPDLPRNINVDSVNGVIEVALVPDTKPVGMAYYVKTSADGGNDLNDGISAPVATINQAIRLIYKSHGGSYDPAGKAVSCVSGGGDTIVVSPGTYNEIVIILKDTTDTKILGLYRNSLPKVTNINIKAAEYGENKVILDAAGVSTNDKYSSSGSLPPSVAPAVYISSDDIVIDGLTVKGITPTTTYHNSYISVSGARDTIKNTFTNLVNNESGILVDGENHLIKNNKIVAPKAQTTDSPVLSIAGYGISVIGNEVSKGMIKIARDSVGAYIIGNVVYDSGVMGGIYTYDGQNLIIAYNVVYNSKRGIMLYRSAHNHVFGNTLVHNPYGIYLDFTWDNHIYNNIITDSTTAGIDFGVSDPLGVSACFVDYNLFYQNIKALKDCSIVTGTSLGFIDGGHNKLGVDPLFNDALNNDYSLKPGSPAIDAGNPDSPVPAGGGYRVDIGKFEFGADNTLPYEFQPKFPAASEAPSFSWEFSDADNDLFGTGTDNQSLFQIQIDKVNTFDSPDLFTSGTVASNKPSVKISNILSPGRYYFRIRLADDLNSSLYGVWSDPDMSFEIK